MHTLQDTVQHEPVHPVLISPSPPLALDRPCRCMVWPPDCVPQSYRGAVCLTAAASVAVAVACSTKLYPPGVKSTIPNSTIPTHHTRPTISMVWPSDCVPGQQSYRAAVYVTAAASVAVACSTKLYPSGVKSTIPTLCARQAMPMRDVASRPCPTVIPWSCLSHGASFRYYCRCL